LPGAGEAATLGHQIQTPVQKLLLWRLDIGAELKGPP
jgi:hypothetical protein